MDQAAVHSTKLTRLATSVLVPVLVLVAFTLPAGAADVFLLESQVGDENWNDAQDIDGNFFWSDSAAAAAGNDYIVDDTSGSIPPPHASHDVGRELHIQWRFVDASG